MRYKHFVLPILLCLTVMAGKSQNTLGTQDVNSFSDLNEKRGRLNTEISNLEKQVGEMYIPDTSFLVKDRANAVSILKNFEKSKKQKLPNDTSLNTLQNNIDYYNEFIARLNLDIASGQAQAKKKEELKTLLDSKKAELSKVENSINLLMIPKISQQNFMFSSSIAFVVLMSILLGTFFFVVWRDAEIRRSIFGSDSGIQFIALFSIIIAIIIFGLAGVLEGKELSALLGSVAGYILGKAKFSGGSNPSPNNTGNTNSNNPNGGTNTVTG